MANNQHQDWPRRIAQLTGAIHQVEQELQGGAPTLDELRTELAIVKKLAADFHEEPEGDRLFLADPSEVPRPQVNLKDFDIALNGDNDQRSNWLLEHEDELRAALRSS